MMTLELGLTAAVIAVVLIALARDVAPAPYVLFAAVLVLLLADVVTIEDALAGFANPAPFTVAALYVVARAVERTGFLTVGIARLLGERGTDRAVLLRLLVPTAAASTVLNNTPIVAMLAPAVAQWAESRRRAASKLLIPLSYAAILGGVVTTIGTSTTLVVSGLLRDAGQPALGLFEPAFVGLPVAVVGLAVVLLLAPRLLPDRTPVRETFEAKPREFSVTMRVRPDGPLDGRTIAEAGLRALKGTYCVQVERAGHAIAPVGPDEVLAGDDELTFVGNLDHVVDLQAFPGLDSTEAHHLGSGGNQRFVEAVVGSSSPLRDRTLKETGFRGRYGGAVVAIHRAGDVVKGKLGETRLRVGDTLLILTDEGFRERWRHHTDFALIAGAGTSPSDARQVRRTIGVLVGLLVVTGTGLLSILEGALVAAVALVGLGVLRPYQAKEAVDVNVVVVIASAFGLGRAVEASGLATVVADGLLALAAPFGDVGTLAGIVVMALVLTELVTNNAAAVLAFPIATAAAGGAGLDPRTAAIGVAVAASLSFLTPIGYQTNLMVYGIGGHRFSDFLRVGVPLSLICLVTVTAMLVFASA